MKAVSINLSSSSVNGDFTRKKREFYFFHSSTSFRPTEKIVSEPKRLFHRLSENGLIFFTFIKMVEQPSVAFSEIFTLRSE